jgi:hypothetical protein
MNKQENDAYVALQAALLLCHEAGMSICQEPDDESEEELVYFGEDGYIETETYNSVSIGKDRFDRPQVVLGKAEQPRYLHSWGDDEVNF